MLYLSWRSNLNNKWFPIGVLTSEGNYRFSYIQGALEAERECGFKPLQCFPSFSDMYENGSLFPFFENRILSKNRLEYPTYVDYLNIEKDKDDPIAILGRSNGRKQTDYFELFPEPELDNEHYHIHFFGRALSHLHDSVLERINHLNPGENLKIVRDVQNLIDPKALMLRTDQEKDYVLVGWLPRYLVNDISLILDNDECKKSIEVTVERVNPKPAPTQFRLLCNLSAQWPNELKPFSDNMFKPIK